MEVLTSERTLSRLRSPRLSQDEVSRLLTGLRGRYATQIQELLLDHKVQSFIYLMTVCWLFVTLVDPDPDFEDMILKAETNTGRNEPFCANTRDKIKTIFCNYVTYYPLQANFASLLWALIRIDLHLSSLVLLCTDLDALPELHLSYLICDENFCLKYPRIFALI